jgi:hypothetical protein
MTHNSIWTIKGPQSHFGCLIQVIAIVSCLLGSVATVLIGLALGWGPK